MAMVSCPKCGFTQPADQYCASCGVDMKAWKPREKPFFIRLATNPVTQVIVVTVVVMATFVYMRENRKRELAAHVRAIEIARQAEEVDQSVGEQFTPRKTRAQASSASTAAPPPQAPQQVAAAPAVARTAPLVAETANAPAGGSAGAHAELAAIKGAPSSIKLTYYEIGRDSVLSLLSDAQRTATEGPLSMGVVFGIEKQMSKGTARELDSASQTLQVNQPAIVYKGARSQTTGANLGFTVQVNPIALDDNGVQIQVDIARVLPSPEAPGGVDDATFSPTETFTLKKGSALVISGLLPHKTPGDNEANFYKTVNVFHPMTSAPFLAGQSEAVLIIEAK